MEMTLGAFVEVYFQDKRGELQQRSIRNRKLEQEQDSLRQENTRLLQEQEGLEEDNRALENEQKKIRDNIEQMMQSEQFIQRDVRKYDEDPQWQLPEPGAFMSAKTYRG